METINTLQMMPIALWAFAVGTGILIILLTFAIQLYYRKRLKELDPLNSDVADLVNQKDKLESDIKSANEWIESNKEELLRLKSEREEQEIIRAEIQRLEQEAAEKESGNKDLLDKVANLENQQHALVQSAERLKKEKEELDEQIKSLGKESKEAKESSTKIKSELETIEKSLKSKKEEEKKLLENFEEKNKDLESVNKNIKKQNETLKSLEDKINELEKYKNKKDEEINEQEKRKASLDAEVKVQTEKIKSIGAMPPEAFESLNKIVFTPPEKSRNNIPENKALDNLYKLTKDKGFDFPKRLQAPFHTSLKTSDTSCLTVMAGVSGTGKSAFPKIYAESMGFYFLPLAVEPRWDSPQDLFGFLNYMENRYESTRLARALVQFNNSPFSNEKANLKDNLLIVMLDEMNLARIEYYFSEFLSKLELRKNSNLSDIKDYRNISTEIFAGSEEEEIQNSEPIFLFAGYNILFVGTMNEDETTQSLSDKVIDRANVLSFGKPDKLKISKQNVQSGGNNFNNQDALEPMLAEDWQNWIREPDATTIKKDFEKVEDLLNDLNNTLSELGRPFGWRTYKSIMSYVANHPVVCIAEKSGLFPLSDQIVMRIMPKLKGLDLNEFASVFEKLDNQIKKVDDPNLAQSFEKARKNPMGFFDWKGINW